MTAPRYLKINGTWYVSKQHMAEQIERVIVAVQVGLVLDLAQHDQLRPIEQRTQEIVTQ